MYLCVCFYLVFLSFRLNTTQYITLNTNQHEMGLFMTCVKCSKTPKYQSSNTTYNKHVFSCVFFFLHNCIQVRSFRLHAMTFCRLQGGQKAGGWIGHHPYIYIYIYIYMYIHMYGHVYIVHKSGRSLP